MTRKPIILSIIFIAVLCFSSTSFPAKAEALNKAISYRTSDKDGNSRFVLDTSQQPDYTISTRHSPERLVIELKNTISGDLKKGPGKTQHITGVRHNLLSDNKLQIVLDIKNQFTVTKYFILPPKENIYRLVVDIANKQETISGGKEFIPTPTLKEVKKPLIALDAGHGGHDPGTTGYHGSQEKNLTLSYAYAIKKALEHTGRYQVILTRKNDNYIDLKKRVEIARNAKANMFLSIHADSHNNQSMSGLSIYTLSEKASDKETEALAQKENSAGLLGNVNVKGDTKDVTELLIDLVQRETKNLSADFAECILTEIRPDTEVLHVNPHRFAGFRVLTAPDIPSALVELGYLSNKDEEKMLLSTKHKNKLAEAIVKAIDNHFEKYPVE